MNRDYGWFQKFKGKNKDKIKNNKREHDKLMKTKLFTIYKMITSLNKIALPFRKKEFKKKAHIETVLLHVLKMSNVVLWLQLYEICTNFASFDVVFVSLIDTFLPKKLFLTGLARESLFK